MDRRKFLKTLGLTTAVSIPLLPVLHGCGTTGLTTYRMVARTDRVVLSLSELADLAEIGGAVEINIDGYLDPVVVLRSSESEFLALSPVCTHLGCTVWKEPTVFRCPCHGSTYALDGSVVRGPAEQSLARYQTEFLGETIVIHLK